MYYCVSSGECLVSPQCTHVSLSDDGETYLFAVLSVATTNLSCAKGRGVEQERPKVLKNTGVTIYLVVHHMVSVLRKIDRALFLPTHSDSKSASDGKTILSFSWT